MKTNKIRRIKKDLIRSKSLKKMSKESPRISNLIKIKESSINIIFRELYEALRQDIESIGYFKEDNFRSHESITVFLREILKEEKNGCYFRQI